MCNSNFFIRHHQLKNFISTTDPDFIYYASEHDIYALHTKSRKRELIASLPWEPQCLDAGFGWICVGGSTNGRCAFIDINEDNLDDEGAGDRISHHHAEVDALLPLDLDPESRLLAHSFLQRSQSAASSNSRKKPLVQIHEVGGSIVNSVAVHRLRSEQEGLEDEVVAVMTWVWERSSRFKTDGSRNNDQTVRIFSLSQSRILTTMNFPTLMNHASISPDGKLLIAVGDEPQAFFCRRIRLPSLAVDGEVAFARYEWHEFAEPRLSSAPPSDACFSTAFSPSGHICAVATQTGFITIFDTSLIRDSMEADEAVVDVLMSSRPHVGRDFCGAVRSMSFAPAPWDLFAWAEDQGRVCVIDLRNAFQSRQTIDLETDSPNLNRASMLDLDIRNSQTLELRQLEIEARFVQRHREALDADDHRAAISYAADYMELSAERRRVEREIRAPESSVREELSLLTESERQILDSLRISRLQESELARADPVQPQLNSNYSQSNTDPAERQADAYTSSGSPSNAASALSNPFQSSNRAMGSMRDYMRQRDLERHRVGDRSYQPRRRSSVVISNGNAMSNSSSSHPSNLVPIGTATPTLSASPSRLASAPVTTAPTPTSTDPWQTIVEAIAPGTGTGDAATRLRRERERDTAFARTADRRAQQQAAQTERMRTSRANVAQLRQLHRTVERVTAGEGTIDDHELDMLRRLQEPRSRRDDGVGTMGIRWSWDGRYLYIHPISSYLKLLYSVAVPRLWLTSLLRYVATEEGILEYTVNLDERKTFPAMDLQ